MGKSAELLAPAGTKESFYGAIKAGADAVYLAGKSFGARAYADNFSESDLLECIRYAHLYGRRLYLTVNTLMKEEELDQLYDFLLPYYEAGLDGVIVQDLGALNRMRKAFPGLELHASTQMTITGSRGAKFLKEEYGVCRVVPARELSLAEVKKMKEESGQEIECFIHGALCYCYSGQCLFSSVLGGRSGNRGRCAQPCRLPYQGDFLKDTSITHPLSLKDLNTLDLLPELLDAGIDSFKIEGRMKSPEYSAGVTSIYRKYIDQYYGEGKITVSKEDRQVLERLYVRSQVSEGYYYRHNGGEMVTEGKPGYNGTPDVLTESIRKKYLEPQFTVYAPAYRVTLQGIFQEGQPASLLLTTTMPDGTVLTGYGEGTEVAAAAKRPVTEADLKKNLFRFGGTVFEADEGESLLTVSDNIFYPMGAVNELRRRAQKALEDEIIRYLGGIVSRQGQARPDVLAVSSATSGRTLDRRAGGISLSVQTREQVLALAEVMKKSDFHPERIYVSETLMLSDPEIVEELKRLEGADLYLSFVRVRRMRDEGLKGRLEQALKCGLFRGTEVHCMEDYAWMRREFPNLSLHLGASMYVWNSESLKALKSDSLTLPLELSAAESGRLLEGMDRTAEKIVYGRIPMMVSAGCIRKTGGKCLHGKGLTWTELEDRMGKHLHVAIDCLHCQNVIYNAVPTMITKGLDRILHKVDFRLDLTTEDREETGTILNYYREMQAGGFAVPVHNPIKEYTTAYENRPVE